MVAFCSRCYLYTILIILEYSTFSFFFWWSFYENIIRNLSKIKYYNFSSSIEWILLSKSQIMYLCFSVSTIIFWKQFSLPSQALNCLCGIFDLSLFIFHYFSNFLLTFRIIYPCTSPCKSKPIKYQLSPADILILKFHSLNSFATKSVLIETVLCYIWCYSFLCGYLKILFKKSQRGGKCIEKQNIRKFYRK